MTAPSGIVPNLGCLHGFPGLSMSPMDLSLQLLLSARASMQFRPCSAMASLLSILVIGERQVLTNCKKPGESLSASLPRADRAMSTLSCRCTAGGEKSILFRLGSRESGGPLLALGVLAGDLIIPEGLASHRTRSLSREQPLLTGTSIPVYNPMGMPGGCGAVSWGLGSLIFG